MTEWREIPGWPEYEASSDGEIRYLAGIVLAQGRTKNGYARVYLVNSHGHKQLCVHPLICEAFHGPKPTPKHEAAHFDGCRTNNRADNLRWATRKENMADKWRHGTMLVGSAAGQAKLTEDEVKHIRWLASQGVERRLLIEKYGVGPAQLSRILNRTRWTHV
jgi:hypothetical protein